MSTQLSPNFLQINAESSTYNYKRAATYSVNGLIATDYLSDTEQMTANYSNNNYGMYKQTQTDAGPIATYYHRFNQNEAYHGVPLIAKSVKTALGADLDEINSNLANVIRTMQGSITLNGQGTLAKSLEFDIPTDYYLIGASTLGLSGEGYHLACNAYNAASCKLTVWFYGVSYLKNLQIMCEVFIVHKDYVKGI